jgi:hypothetical protein
MYWTQTRSSSRSPRPAQPNNRMNDEFIALNRGLLKHASETVSWRRLAAAPGADASAIHGRLGAQVALLQSPILPVAGSLYQEKALFRNVPVDKPHTRDLRLRLEKFAESFACPISHLLHRTPPASVLCIHSVASVICSISARDGWLPRAALEWPSEAWSNT